MPTSTAESIALESSNKAASLSISLMLVFIHRSEVKQTKRFPLESIDSLSISDSFIIVNVPGEEI